MKKYITITLSTLTLLTCFTGCGKKESSDSSKTDKIEAQTAALSTVAANTGAQDEIQQALEEQKKAENNKTPDEPESGIIKHKDRPYDGIYLEDYVTVTFSGYEHDSKCELTVDWDAIAKDLGNGITPEIIETIAEVRIYNDPDLVNGDKINIIMDEKTLQETFKQKFSKEIEYIDDNVYYYEETPVIVSGLKTKTFVQDASEVDMTVLEKSFDDYMANLKADTQDYDNKLPISVLDQFLNKKIYREIYIDQVVDRDIIMSDETDYCRINDYILEGTYLATRTMSSYNDSNASDLPENMVFNIYKLSLERYKSEEKFDLYYLTGMSDLLFEDNKMIITDEMVEADFNVTIEELMPDNKYWDIQEVK